MNLKRTRSILAAMVITLGAGTAAMAQSAGKPDIRLGTILPFSGPASSYSASGKAAIAYFDKLNSEDGGIGGRKISIVSYDDGYSPPKTFEMARKLVESDEVLLLFNTFGTPTNMSIMKYLNAKKVPQLFVGTGGAIFGDAKANPWTMGLRPDYQSEGAIYARHILAKYPDAKIGVIYQNDDFGKDHLRGLKAGLGANASMIVAEQPYEVSSPSIDSQIVSLKAANVDLLVNFASNKFAAQTIRKVGELNWKPTQFLASASASIAAVLKPAGLQHAGGIITTAYLKDPDDVRWKDDAGVARWRAFMTKYYPGGDQQDLNTVTGYNGAQVMEQVLKQAGDDLSRANIMRQAASLKNFETDMLLPGIKVNTGPDDHRPLEDMQLVVFQNERWIAMGEIISGQIKE